MFRRLFRLRLMPRDVFSKLDDLIAAARSNAAAIEGLRREVADTADQREIVRRLAAVQDELVRRVMAERRTTAESTARDAATGVRLDALAREADRLGTKLDAVLARLEDRDRPQG